ncbi:futalosine hydrolase [Phytomonospora sp. NPDC050363]|uniref:futalosine hydrolase n=1 Tax=Phytomonospora sp. NPDC050363 TaxID=3155642 RepID=UPI0033C4EE36
MTLLIVTAVDAERDAVRAGLKDNADISVQTIGLGPAQAAAATTLLLTKGNYRGVVSAGIAGAFAGRAEIGDTVVATRAIAADLGAQSPRGWLPVVSLGFGGVSSISADSSITANVDGHRGAVLTLATVTGTQETADELAGRYPDAHAEAMEGFGVATAAKLLGVPFAEIRTISNIVGPRDKDGWRLQDAFAALTKAVGGLA